MSTPKIRNLLEARLKTYADANSLQVAWQNVPFTPPATTYLRAFVLPANNGSETLEGEHIAYSGVFQVNVVAPINSGPAAAESIAEGVQFHFPNNLRLTGGSLVPQIVGPPSIATALQNPESFVIPVSIRYRADAI